MATQSYRERLKAARAEASARRKAEQAERQRQIELRCEVHRLALAAVKAGIQAKGQRKLSTYSRAELTMMANALIAPWFIEQVQGQDRCSQCSQCSRITNTGRRPRPAKDREIQR